MSTETRLKTILNTFRDVRILVIGDFYLDAYWHIDKTRSTLSLETPWHTNPVVAQRYSPGAAGTVTNNLNALGVGKIYTLGVIGEDGFGQTLLNCLREKGCVTDFMIQAPERVTPTYLKPMHRGYEGVENEGPRFDIENQVPMAEAVENRVISALHECVPRVDAVIIGDQMPHENLGVVTTKVRETLCELALAFPEKIFFADSRTRIGAYRNVIVKPNRFEAMRAVEPKWQGDSVDRDTAERCARILAERTGKPVYVTLGAEGILVCNQGKITHIPGIRLDCAADPVGAGDSVSAGLVATLCATRAVGEPSRSRCTPVLVATRGLDSVSLAAYVGNLVASITVTKLGETGTASPEEILQRHRSLTP